MNVIINRKIVKAAVVLLVAAIVYALTAGAMPEEARRMLAIFIIAALFWSFEITPLYATSLLVILLETFLLSLPAMTKGFKALDYEIFFMPFGSPIIILFFGGFTLAYALSKYQIDKIIAVWMLKLFGSRPYFLMCGFMCTTAFLSMWMSDTATSAMMIALVGPLLGQLDLDDPFRTALILCIPFSALIGGMGTPVGTPPNAIAIGILADHGKNIDFLTWMKIALPFVITILCFISFILYTFFPCKKKCLHFAVKANFVASDKMYTAALIGLGTVLLWLSTTFHHIPSAVIALLAAGLLALSGLLDKEDFKRINWDILILMWGGLALGKGMTESGLAKWIIALPLFDQQGFLLLIVFCVLAVTLSTLISNTATANMLIPLVVAIPNENIVILASAVALSCSLAMALPVSTPPNAIAFSTNMLKAGDMLRAGLAVSIVSVVIILLGFRLFVVQLLGS